MTRSNPKSLGEGLSYEIPEGFSEPGGFLNEIKAARSHVSALRSALLSPAQSPGELIGCVPGLSKAAACLGAVEHQLKAQPAVSIVVSIVDVRELKSLKSELRAVRTLIEHGAAFHRGWARLLGAAAAGYTSSGEAAPLMARGSVAMEG
jgi:hypothetical protein